jgi:hypothetical protein
MSFVAPRLVGHENHLRMLEIQIPSTDPRKFLTQEVNLWHVVP